MSAPTGVVLAASALVSSPILLLLYDGTISATGALQRWLVCVVLCRVAISVVAALAFPPDPPQPVGPESGAEGAADRPSGPVAG